MKGDMAWLCDETATKYPKSTSQRKLLLPLPSSYLVGCGFSAVNDLLHKNKSTGYHKTKRLEIKTD